MRIRHQWVCCSAVVLGVLLQCNSAQAQKYVWRRLVQEMHGTSTITVSVNGNGQQESANGGTTGDYLLVEKTFSKTDPVLGGGGGGGGDSGGVANPQPGGTAAQGVDGTDGRTATTGGKGGKKGGAGISSALGQAVAVDGWNPDALPIFEYSFIHNNICEAELKGGGGGGGGGAGGTHRATVPGFPGMFFDTPGQPGGMGGLGATSTVSVNSQQTSGCDAVAFLDVGPDFIPGTTSPNTTAEILIEIGWVSSGFDFENILGQTWQRSINLRTIVRNIDIRIVGGPEGFPWAEGTDGAGNAFFLTSTSTLSSDTGSFSVGPGDVGATPVSLNNLSEITTGFLAVFDPSTGTWTTGQNTEAIASLLRGNMLRNGGFGGPPGAPNGVNGGNAPSTGNGLGGPGGAGGAGGLGSAAGVPGGGAGGTGGAGDQVAPFKGGFFSGIAQIEVAQ